MVLIISILWETVNTGPGTWPSTWDPRTQSPLGCVALQQIAIAKIKLYSQYQTRVYVLYVVIMHTEGLICLVYTAR